MFSSLFSNVWAIFLVILFFGGSIFIHELGHFLAAKKRGLKIERFSIGFGPKILTWKRDGIEYCISLLPLGGYVALPQLAEMSAIEGQSKEKALPPISYTDKMIVSVMGAVFNVIFAFILATILWQVGIPTSPQDHTTIVGHVEPALQIDPETQVEGPAFLAGILPGDHILEVDGLAVSRFSDIQKAIMMGSGRTEDNLPQVNLKLDRAGQVLDITARPALIPTNTITGDAMRMLGISPAENLVIKSIIEHSPAAKAGLMPQDKLISANGQTLFALRALSNLLQEQPLEPAILEVLRDNKVITIEMTPELIPYTKPTARIHVSDMHHLEFIPSSKNTNADFNSTITLFSKPEGDTFSHLSYGDKLITVDKEPASSIAHLIELTESKESVLLGLEGENGSAYNLHLGTVTQASINPPLTIAMIGIELDNSPINLHENPFTQFKNTALMTLKTLGSLIHKDTDIQVQNLMGAPGIMRVIHSFSTIDIRLVLWFTVLLNINLAVLNLLPIPVLDGGHMLFATIGRLRRKELPPAFIANTQGLFMIMLFSLMIYISFFDIRRWQGDSQRDENSERQMSLYIQPEFKPKN